MNETALLEDLKRDEGNRLTAYDDANGAPLVPGYRLVGHPTIGIGRALDVHGISPAESVALCLADIRAVSIGLSARLPYWSRLDDARQRVIANIAFNAGVDGALKFERMLAAIAAGNFHVAALELYDSKLKQQAPERAARLAALLQSPAITKV
jgi:lysozyme